MYWYRLQIKLEIKKKFQYISSWNAQKTDIKRLKIFNSDSKPVLLSEKKNHVSINGILFDHYRS
jgi:hypothetical protein